MAGAGGARRAQRLHGLLLSDALPPSASRPSSPAPPFAEIGSLPRRDRSYSGSRSVRCVGQLVVWRVLGVLRCPARGVVGRGVMPFSTGSVPSGVSECVWGDRLWCPGAGRRGDRHRGGWALSWRSSGPGAGVVAGGVCGGLAERRGPHVGAGEGEPARGEREPSACVPARAPSRPTPTTGPRPRGGTWTELRGRAAPRGGQGRRRQAPGPGGCTGRRRARRPGCDASETEAILTRSSTDLDEGGRGRPAPRNRASTERVGPGASPGRCPRGRRPSASRGRPRRRAHRRR